METTFGERLRALRTEKGALQSDIATMLGVSGGSYSAYEGGREPEYKKLVMLAKYFGVSTDYLVGASPLKNPEHQTVVDDLGLNEQSLDVLKKWRSKMIGDYIDNKREEPIEKDYSWMDILNMLISTEGFEELIIWIGKRIHPYLRKELSMPITGSSFSGDFKYTHVFEAVIQETLINLVLKMEKEILQRE